MTPGSSCARPDIVLLSTADWDNPFWTNKQHVALSLARRGHRVLYIDSLGLRPPTVKAQDLRRILRRLWRGLRPPRRVAERVLVWSPISIPWQKYGFIRFCNRILLATGLVVWMRLLGLRREMLWTYNPMTLRLFPFRSFPKAIYHCVDEIKAQPGMPAREIETAERELVRAADICFVTAEHLLEARRCLNPHTHCFGNVADFGHFVRARAVETAVPPDLAALPAPRLGFVGAVSGYKVDFALLRRLAKHYPQGSIVLIGKVGEGDPHTDVSALENLPNVHLLGARDYRELPGYLKGFDVALLPCTLNDYTRGMFPMKFFEYLAAGCPVVSTNLPALRSYESVAYLTGGHDEFIAAVGRVLAGDCASLAARLDAAREHTYEARTASMMTLVEA